MRPLPALVYVAGLLLVVASAWAFLAQPAPRGPLPVGTGLAILLFLAGLAAMIAAASRRPGEPRG